MKPALLSTWGGLRLSIAFSGTTIAAQTESWKANWDKVVQPGKKGGAFITPGSGGVALISQAAHPNAAMAALDWLLSRAGDRSLIKK
jgi:ABC-type Fe3+ transport system substrate-binding protein